MHKAIVFAFVVCFVAQIGSACRCLPDRSHLTPQYCRTPFLGIVKITRAEWDHNGTTKHYYFELIKDLNNFGEVHRSSLKGFAAVDDNMAGTSCQQHLDVNQTYLIGAHLGDGGKPILTACSSWIQHWSLSGEKSDAQIAEYKAKCGHVTN